MEFLRGRRDAPAQRHRVAENKVANRAIAVLLAVMLVLIAGVVFGFAAALSRAFPTKERLNYRTAPAQQTTSIGIPA